MDKVYAEVNEETATETAIATDEKAIFESIPEHHLELATDPSTKAEENSVIENDFQQVAEADEVNADDSETEQALQTEDESVMEYTSKTVVESTGKPIKEVSSDTVEEHVPESTTEAAEREVLVDITRVTDDPNDETELVQLEEPVKEPELEEPAIKTE